MDKKSQVFVVYGRNKKIYDSMFNFLTSVGLHPLEFTELIAETGSGSPYVGDVIEKGFQISQAAIVLMTPDDEAQLRKELRGEHEAAHETNLTPQPRTNVLVEAGMALGKFPKRTIIVEFGTLRPISDITGRHNVRMDNSPEKRQELISRLKTAGCLVNDKGQRWIKTGDFELEKSYDIKQKEVELDPIDSVDNNSKALSDLAKECNLTIGQIHNVISIRENKIEIVATIDGNDTSKQVIASQCFLFADEIIFKQEWTKASSLTETLSLLGIGNLGNLAHNLMSKKGIFLKRGKLKNVEYKLSTGTGRASAREVIKKLAGP